MQMKCERAMCNPDEIREEREKSGTTAKKNMPRSSEIYLGASKFTMKIGKQ